MTGCKDCGRRPVAVGCHGRCSECYVEVAPAISDMNARADRSHRRNINEQHNDEQRIRDYEQWLTSLRNYAWIRDVASGATDLDLLIERRGHFLVLEGKTWQADGLHVPVGQHIMFSSLCALDAFDVYLVGETHDEDDPYRIVEYAVFTPYKRGSYVVFPAGVFEPATDDDMRQLVRRWLQQVERGGQ